MQNFDHENSHRHEFTSRLFPKKIPVDIRECISMSIFVKLWCIWQYLGEQASDQQLPVSRICKQRQNYESVKKILRFLGNPARMNQNMI